MKLRARVQRLLTV